MSVSPPQLLEERLSILKDDNFDVNSTTSVAAAVVLGTIGVLSFIVQPGLAFGFATTFEIDEGAANRLLAAEGFGIATSAVLAAFLSRFANWRLLTAVFLILAVLGNTASALVGEPNHSFMLARGLTGLGEGGIVTLSFSMVGLTQRVERNLAIYLALLLTYGALGLWLLPAALGAIGLSGIFIVWAVLSVLALALVPFVAPYADSREETSPTAAYVGLPMLIIAVLAVLAYNTAIGIAWANLFFVGMEILPDEEAVAGALLASQFVAIGGAFLAIFLETKLGRWLPIISGILLGAVSMAILLGNPAFTTFVLAVCLFNFVWNYVLPFILSSVEDMRYGEMMTVSIAAQMLGLTVLGPLAAAEILGRGGDLGVALQVTILLLVLSLVMLAVSKLARRASHARTHAD